MLTRRDLLKIAAKTGAVLPFVGHDLWRPKPAHAAITIFGAASSPADNGAQSDAAARSVTPPASMLNNDYVTLLALGLHTTGAITISDTGGQTWTSETQLTSTPTGGTASTTAVNTRLFHARFNGTWSADPAVQVAASTGNSLTLVMLVFRGVDTTTAVDVSPVSAGYNATTTPTIGAITTNTANAMAVAFWTSRGSSNTWSLVTSGWGQFHAQIRNTAGTDGTVSHAYKIQAAAGSTGDVQNDQATLGPDAGHTWILALKPAAGSVSRGGLLRRRGGM